MPDFKAYVQKQSRDKDTASRARAENLRHNLVILTPSEGNLPRRSLLISSI